MALELLLARHNIIMAYRTRSARRLARKSKNSFITTIIISGLLIYFGLFWVLPNLINGIGLVNKVFKPAAKGQDISQNTTFGPPTLNIPYEATNSSQIDIHGYSTPNAKVNIYIDDQLKTTARVDSDGIFTAQNVDLNLGTNNIYGKTVDSQEKESLASKTIRLIYDNEKPALDISQPSDGQVVKGDKKVTIQGKTNPGVIVTVNGKQIIINSDGNFSSEQSLNDGDNSFTIRSTDKASNFNEVTRKVTFQP